MLLDLCFSQFHSQFLHIHLAVVCMGLHNTQERYREGMLTWSLNIFESLTDFKGTLSLGTI